MLPPSYILPDLASLPGLETVPVLKALNSANRSLAELKGRAASIPNQGILIDSLALQEAKASSEVENIVTTQDELFGNELFPEAAISPAVKEVEHYRDALKFGYADLRKQQDIIRNASLLGMFRILKNNSGGYRATPGTCLRNDRTGENVYIPPQDKRAIESAMGALLNFINDDAVSAYDPLVKMALIHHQFESIHPFPDGNGRIGRILNVLYLTRTGLLDIPILYLSRQINASKNEYYRLLQQVRESGAWEEWLLYMIRAIDETSKTTLHLVEAIRQQMADMKRRLRADLPALYSQDLLNNLFRHPYTRIEFIERDLQLSRQTASRYLEKLTEKGFVEKHKKGRQNYYINTPLVGLFLSVSA